MFDPAQVAGESDSDRGLTPSPQPVLEVSSGREPSLTTQRSQAQSTVTAEEPDQPTPREEVVPDEPPSITEPPDEPTLLHEQDSARRLAQLQATPQPKLTRDLAPGQLFGRYRLLRQLGEGGMGVVYEAFDPELERKVALKLISIGDATNSDQTATTTHIAQARLVLEAQAQAKLIHANVVAVYDVGTSVYGVYMAMELINGQTVKQWLRAQPRHWREIVAVFLQAAAGLAAAHDAGLIHRDFKPDNLLMGEDGRIRVADFGLATGHLQRREQTGGQLSQLFDTTQVSQGIAGTPSYMPPEQHRGGKITAKSDQYAFCVSLYEALYGAKPFRGTHRAELLTAIEKRQFQPIKRKHRVPRWLHEAVLRGLNGDPKNRFGTLHELVQALDEGLHRKTMPMVASALGVAAALALVGGWANDRTSQQQQCEAKAQKVHEAWSPEAWQAIDEAFFASGLPYAKDTANTVFRVITDRLEEWSAVYLAACEQHVETPTAAAAVYECLDGQMAELQTLATLYRQATSKDVQGAVQLVNGLSHADNCTVESRRHEDRDRPRESRELAGYIDLNRQLQALRTATKLSDRATLDGTTKRLLSQAKELAIPALLAPVLSIQSTVDANRMEIRQALRGSDLALLFAHASHDPVLRANIMREQIFLRGYKLGMDAAAHDIYHLGQAYLIQAGNDPVESASTCVASVPYLMFSGHGDQAEQCLRAALETFERVYGPRHSETIRALEYLAVTISFRRIDTEAETLLLRARESLVEMVGAWHPQLAMTHYNLSSLAGAQGAVRTAAHYLEQAAAIADKSGVDHELRLVIDLNYADTLRQRGQLKATQATYRHCLNAVENSQDPISIGPRTSCTIGLALSEAEFGDYHQCGLASTLLDQVTHMQVTGLFGDNARLGTLSALRELASVCGEHGQARLIEDQRLVLEKTYYSQFGRHREFNDLAALDLQKVEHGAVATEARLRSHLAHRLPQDQSAGRMELLELRRVWAKLSLDLGLAEQALAILTNDAPWRELSVGNEPYATWSTDVLRARALLQLGRADEALALVEPLVTAVDAGDQDLETSAYLHAILGRAKLARDPHSPTAWSALATARQRAHKLRQPPPALLALIRS